MKPNVIAELAAWRAEMIVSAYLPVDRGRPIDELKARLHSMAKSARDLVAPVQGHAAGEAVATRIETMALEPLMGGRGVALFASPDAVRRVTLSSPPAPSVSAGIEPDLLGVVGDLGDVEYYALALSLDDPRLFRGSRDELELVDVPDMPKGIDDALWFVRRETGLSRHGSGAVHGTGGDRDLKKTDMRRYLKAVDDALARVLRGQHRPLVVCGVEYEAAMFIEETAYRHVWPAPVAPGPGPLDERDLHERTWQAIRVTLREAAEDVAADVRRRAGTGTVAFGAPEVAQAVTTGAAAGVAVAHACTQRAAGAFREVAHAVNLAFAAHLPVTVVGDADLPDGAVIAARLRY